MLEDFKNLLQHLLRRLNVLMFIVIMVADVLSLGPKSATGMLAVSLAHACCLTYA